MGSLRVRSSHGRLCMWVHASILFPVAENSGSPFTFRGHGPTHPQRFVEANRYRMLARNSGGVVTFLTPSLQVSVYPAFFLPSSQPSIRVPADPSLSPAQPKAPARTLFFHIQPHLAYRSSLGPYSPHLYSTHLSITKAPELV